MESVDVMWTSLTATGQMPGAPDGEARTAERVLYEDEYTEIGIWEVTPGSFDAVHGAYVEHMHFIAGDALVTGADGSVYQARPGRTLTVPAGWRGRWEVRTTVRKTYVLVREVGSEQ
jgi:uncharacterized protein